MPSGKGKAGAYGQKEACLTFSEADENFQGHPREDIMKRRRAT